MLPSKVRIIGAVCRMPFGSEDGATVPVTFGHGQRIVSYEVTESIRVIGPMAPGSWCDFFGASEHDLTGLRCNLSVG